MGREKGGASKGTDPRSLRSKVQNLRSPQLPSPSVPIWVGSIGLPVLLFRHKPLLGLTKLCPLRPGPGSSLWLTREAEAREAPAPPLPSQPEVTSCPGRLVFWSSFSRTLPPQSLPSPPSSLLWLQSLRPGGWRRRWSKPAAAARRRG